MKYHIILWLFVFSAPFQLLAQVDGDLEIIAKNGIYKHSILSTHPFSIFFLD